MKILQKIARKFGYQKIPKDPIYTVTYYISKDGSDSNSGTRENPKNSISGVISSLSQYEHDNQKTIISCLDDLEEECLEWYEHKSPKDPIILHHPDNLSSRITTDENLGKIDPMQYLDAFKYFGKK